MGKRLNYGSFFSLLKIMQALIVTDLLYPSTIDAIYRDGRLPSNQDVCKSNMGQIRPLSRDIMNI